MTDPADAVEASVSAWLAQVPMTPMPADVRARLARTLEAEARARAGQRAFGRRFASPYDLEDEPVLGASPSADDDPHRHAAPDAFDEDADAPELWEDCTPD